MADQKLTDAALTNAVKTFYDKRLIETLQPKQYLYQFAQKRPIPRGGGKTIEFTAYKKINPVGDNSADLATATQLYLSAYTITDTLIIRQGYVKFGRLLMDTMIDPGVTGAVEQIADVGARTVECYLRQKIVARIGFATRSSAANADVNGDFGNFRGDLAPTSAQQHHRIYSDYPLLNNKARLATSASVTDTVAGSAMSISQVRHAVSYLRSRDANPYPDGNFVGIAHTWTLDQLMQDPKWENWNRYTNAEAMYKGEVGRIQGVRFVLSNQAFRYTYSAAPWSTASGSLNGTFIFGPNSFAVTEIEGSMGGSRGYELIIKRPGPSTLSDPVNMVGGTVGFKLTMASAVLQKSAGVVVLTSDRAVTSAS